ncbi:PTS transporter subunit EIIB [Streptomyces sp. NRRL B-1677]|uniref:PTS transporter subunit EIIB n=1 Tax=Streptomyces sp. NRRL B-1677 TaxID=2682966 RepID=UPI001892C847|nr:PTS transporter subunit EIIB [Streptomyces sp. NRRL B-1677]
MTTTMNTSARAAAELLVLLGGPANIAANADYCATRLRITVRDLHAVRGHALHDHRIVLSIIKRPNSEIDIVVGHCTAATLSLLINVAVAEALAEAEQE